MFFKRKRLGRSQTLFQSTSLTNWFQYTIAFGLEATSFWKRAFIDLLWLLQWKTYFTYRGVIGWGLWELCHGSLIPCFLLVSCSLLCVCVSVHVGVPTHQRWSTSQRSSSTPAAAHHTTLYILTTLSSPLSDRCLLSWMFGVPVFIPVRVLVGCTLRIHHGTSGLLFTALIWPSKSLRHYPGSVKPAPIFLTGGLIKSIYSHTVSAFLSWQNDLTVQWKQRVALPDRWMTSWAAAYFVWILRRGTSAIQLALFRL